MTIRIEVCSCVLNDMDVHKIDVHKYSISIHYLDKITGQYAVQNYKHKYKEK